MKSFEQHSDGRVYVRSGDALYIDTLENFIADFGEAPEAIPEGAHERMYTQGRRHAFNGPEGTVAGGDMPYDLGDRAIAQIEDLIGKAVVRATPTSTPQDEQGQQSVIA